MAADGTVTWRALWREAVDTLAAGGVADAEVSARRIVEQASGYAGAEWVLGLDEAASQRGVASLDRMVARRLAGEPLQYVVGGWGFRTLDLLVDRRVLIPRPETEWVVERALRELDGLAAATTRRPLVAVDLGTGSGAIALSLAAERPFVEVWATDVSTDALDVARANLAGAGRAATRVRLAEGSWGAALPDELVGRVDLVVSNPPYVATNEVLPPEVADWEPRGALFAGPDGLECVVEVLGTARRFLTSGGVVVVELAPAQADGFVTAAEAAGLEGAEVAPDQYGRPRAGVARRAAGTA